MLGTERIQSLITAPWVMWVMLFTLLLFLIAYIHQPHLMRTAWYMVFKRQDRVYNDAAVIGISSLELRFFCLLTASMSLAIAMKEGSVFRFGYYALVVACVLGWYIVRWCIRECIAWVGKLKHYGFPKGFMMSLCFILTTVLYVINLGFIWIPNARVWTVLMGIVLLLWLVMIWIKHYSFFVHDWKTFLGCLSYWVIVEVGSLVGLYFLIKVL